MNVYSVPGVKSGNRKNGSLVVWVGVSGDDTIEYEVAVGGAVHVKSTVVGVGLLAMKSVTASGGAGRVCMSPDHSPGVVPAEFTALIWNEYTVSGSRPVNVYELFWVVCVVVGGLDSIE